MAKKSEELLDYLGKYVQLSDGRKGVVLAPYDGRTNANFLVIKDRLDNLTLSLVNDDGLSGTVKVWRLLGTIDNEPMQPHVAFSDLRELLKDGKRFRELRRLLD